MTSRIMRASATAARRSDCPNRKCHRTLVCLWNHRRSGDNILQLSGVNGGKIYGRAGRDTVYIGEGRDFHVDAGADDDVIYVAHTSTTGTVVGGTGLDTLDLSLMEFDAASGKGAMIHIGKMIWHMTGQQWVFRNFVYNQVPHDFSKAESHSRPRHTHRSPALTLPNDNRHGRLHRHRER